MKIDNFLLLLLEEFNGIVESETRIQKLAFLVTEEKGINLGIKFKWHHYGPFSRSLKNCLTKLRKNNLIKIDKQKRLTFMGDPYTIHIFSLSNLGHSTANQIKERLSKESQLAIHNLTIEYGYSPLNDLLEHVYQTYSPDDL